MFYASDFLTDTAEFTPEEVGVYIRLLCTQWVNGDLPKEDKRLASIVGMSISEFVKIFAGISHKFDEKKQGRIVNLRLEKVRKERSKFIEQARKAGIEGANVRWGKDSKPDSEPYSENMPLQSSPSSPSSSPSSIPNSKERGKPDINECIEYLKQRTLLDGTEKSNRYACSNLLKKLHKEFPGANLILTVKALIELALNDEFHSKNLTNFGYLYRNWVKISKLKNNGQQTHENRLKDITDLL